MDLLLDIAYPFLSLSFFALLFIPMERVFPARLNQKIFRKHWFLDLLYALGQYYLFSALVNYCILILGEIVISQISSGFHFYFSELHFAIQVFILVFMSDILIYWCHRLQHKVDFLWRFHKVHHSAETLDWLAAHREHPIDSIYTVFIINLPAFLLGFSLESIAGFITFRGIWAIFIHSNTDVNLGTFKKLIGSPKLHHWHHDIERDRGNYANLSPLMDIIFGTYYYESEEPEKFGIKEEFKQHYFYQLIRPILPKHVFKNL